MNYSVASGHEQVTKTALNILKEGGNAFDAIIAASFVSCVVEPLLTSLGGGGYAVYSENSQSTPQCYDFFARFPGSEGKVEAPVLREIAVEFKATTQIFYSGKGSIAVPGLLKGLFHLYDKFASKDLETLLTPAINIAEEGFPLNETQSHVAQLLEPILKMSAPSRELFMAGGEEFNSGVIYQNIKLANYLRSLINNRDLSFYSSPFAEEIQVQVENHSPLTAENLKNYKVLKNKAHEINYRDIKIYSPGEPALGGQALEVLFKALETHDLSQFSWGSCEHLKALHEVLKTLEDQELNPFKKGTTHISVFDGEAALSLSMTNGEGSGYYPPNTGVMFNNMLGEDDVCGDDHTLWKPNHPLPSMMAPCIVKLPTGEQIILGSGGSKRIRSSILQVISNLVDFKMDLRAAIHSPRVNWDGTCLQVESGFSSEEIHKLKKYVTLNLWPSIDFYFGGVHCVHTGQKVACGDPRRGGVGLSYKRGIL